jgi:phosphate-selective porin OprO/OprP
VEFQYVSDSGFSFKEANMRFKELPTVGSFWVGQLTMPQGFEMMMSSKDITFMEVAAPLEALAPGTKFGFQLGDPFLDGRGTLNAGIFTDTNQFEYGDGTDALARIGGRITYLPHISGDNEELDLLHVGLSSSLVYSPHSKVRYSSRPESHLSPELVDTGDIDAELSWVSGLEAAAVWGPLHVQSELISSFVKVEEGSPLNFWGAYMHVGWFPTGEVLPYNKDGGYFGHLNPNQPIEFPGGPSQGAGALELSARFSYTDLDDELIEGGRMGILMTGATWFLSKNVRWMLNIGAAALDHPGYDGGLYIVQTRFQWTY